MDHKLHPSIHRRRESGEQWKVVGQKGVCFCGDGRWRKGILYHQVTRLWRWKRAVFLVDSPILENENEGPERTTDCANYYNLSMLRVNFDSVLFCLLLMYFSAIGDPPTDFGRWAFAYWATRGGFCMENKNKMCFFQRVARVPKKPDRRYSFFVILSGKKMGSSRSNNEPVSDPSGVRV